VPKTARKVTDLSLLSDLRSLGSGTTTPPALRQYEIDTVAIDL
jgi:hypothetical protein